MAAKLYDHQSSDLSIVLERVERYRQNYNLLYQLPTGGGKTMIFSELARRYIEQFGKKVVVLTHRKELSRQTSATLKKAGVSNMLVNTIVKKISRKNSYQCYVAMVETLKNRIRSGHFSTLGIGLVIIDEAHNNSFRKLLGFFEDAFVVGVTATPLSSDITQPMNEYYNELIIGKDIGSLIREGFLAKPTAWRYDVELNTLKTGIHGDYTVATSDELYSSPAMLDLLLRAYETHSKNKKTLIFNTGIFTSKRVREKFREAGYVVRHLDNKTPAEERKEILAWFRRTRGAILTSVSILTTGFDEPTVQSVILNRATTSLTLYHQMIGRGSRRLPSKKTFTIIDLGNNTDRFGPWEEPLDWQYIFDKPEEYYRMMCSRGVSESHSMPSDLRSKFPNSLEIAFDVDEEYRKALANEEKPKSVINESIRQHAFMCMENSQTISEALALAKELDKEIDWRIKQYAKCHGNTTKNYREWLGEDYRQRLQTLIKKVMPKRALAA